MGENKKQKSTEKQKRFSIGIIISIIAVIGAPCGFYAYQYGMRPEINIIDIEAQYTKTTQEDNMRIDLSFKIKNDGKSKTRNSRLFSAFPKWAINQLKVIVVPYDFTDTDIPDLVGGRDHNFTIYKDINADDFVQYNTMAKGFYLIAVLRWQSDNWAHFGQTFENHVLLFLEPRMQENKMLFQVKQIEQKYFIHWFMKQTDRPDIFRTVEGLGVSRLLYGDVSRFD